MRARMLIAAVVVMVLAGAASADARTSSGTRDAAASDRGTLTVDVSVNRFAVAGRRIVAHGRLTGSLSGGGGAQSASQPVALSVQAVRGRCQVLSLTLQDLRLDLLGLRVDLSEVNLRIRGFTRGDGSGVLGRLFCSLTRSTIRLGRSAGATSQARKVVRALNSRLERRPLRAFRAVAAIAPGAGSAQAQAPSCSVLTLVLGPLNLNLLGLVVDLYGANRNAPVTLTITAFQGQGALGDLFCNLAGGPQP